MSSRKEKLVTAEEDKLSLEDKLALIDAEIRTLFEFCKDNGYKPEEIESAASPFFKSVQEIKLRKWKKRGLVFGKVIGVLFATLLVLTYVTPVNRVLKYAVRKTCIKILPYWDWTPLYDSMCLIDNPYYLGNKPTEEDCAVCESYDTIDRLSNVSLSLISVSYLQGSLPVIVTDGMQDWGMVKGLTVKELDEIYKDDEALRDYMSCQFMSNIRVKYGNHRAILRKVAKGEINSYFAHWENCLKEPAKSFRQMYKRPYFLPPMVEMDDTNWLFISENFKAKSYKKIQPLSNMLMLVQVKGEFSIKVRAKFPCAQTCNEMIETLHEGEIMLIPDFLWVMEYLPMGDGENIMIGVGGNFD